MWKVNVPDLQMTDGDFGLTLPITISGAELTSADPAWAVYAEQIYAIT